MKHLLSIMLISMLFFSCKKETGLTSQTAQADLVTPGQQNVKLYKSWSLVAAGGAEFITGIKTYYVEVANLAYQKNVYAHQKMADGTWQDLPLTYLTSIDPSTDMFGLVYNYSSNSVNPVLADSFALKYVVNGQTYWDNNGGQNYTVSGADGMYLQNGVNVSVDTNYSYFSTQSTPPTPNFTIYVDVRNIAYAKNVSVVYSTDGWKTVQTVPLSFDSLFAINNVTFLVNPNRFGIERWNALIVTAPSTQKYVQFAVSYTVNGQTYWDNNFGKNYQLQSAY
jgi:hypothetical protein